MLRVKNFTHALLILVPRGRAPFDQNQESRPLARSNTGCPRFTDFPSPCACSESSLTNLIGSGLNLLCLLQSHSKRECRWTWPEVAILGADQKERGVWGWREWCSTKKSAAIWHLLSEIAICYLQKSNPILRYALDQCFTIRLHKDGKKFKLFHKTRWLGIYQWGKIQLDSIVYTKSKAAAYSVKFFSEFMPLYLHKTIYVKLYNTGWCVILSNLRSSFIVNLNSINIIL